ncbi:MAG TPA: TetR/AcrR family transcriptional regulator [Acidimicrobiales bacterium]
MTKQSRSLPVMQAVLDEVCEQLMNSDESLIRIPDVCKATGVNYGSVYHHFGSREGVIDAAYNMLFSKLAEEDIQVLRDVSDTATSLDEYMAALAPLVERFSSGPDRLKRRSIRVRIVAASITRPELRVLIGLTQNRLTDELVRLVALGQDRGWLRRDITARSIAVALQVLIFGRILDDISLSPIDTSEWEFAMGAFFASLFNLP